MKKLLLVLLALLFCAQTAFALEGTEMIAIDGHFSMADAGESYPATLLRGASAADGAALLSALSKDGFAEEEPGLFVENAGGEVWERKRLQIDSETGEVWYYDPMVSGERGAEYEAPALGLDRAEGLEKCVGLLEGAVPAEYFDCVNEAYPEADRWNTEGREYMDDEEYERYCRAKKLLYFRFDQVECGLPVLGEGLTVSIGANGLNGFTLRRHAFDASEEKAALLPLQEAVEMASSTRSAPARLLYAQPVYSNRVSGDEKYNLSWYLVTDSGNYVVDCVLGEHVCDSWEY